MALILIIALGIILAPILVFFACVALDIILRLIMKFNHWLENNT